MITKLKRLTYNGIKILRQKGLSAFLKRAKEKANDKLERAMQGDPISIEQLVRKYLFVIKQFNAMQVTRQDLRLNVVIDSLEKKNVFGGVATSMIFASLLAKKLKCTLRVISRRTESQPKVLLDFLKLIKIDAPEQLEFYADNEINASFLEVSEQDIFIATSWWSVKAIEKVNLRAKFYYLLQEVETLFYSNNDEHFLCETTLTHDRIHYILNSKVLREYYQSHGYDSLIKNSHAFEPAFPQRIYRRTDLDFKPKEKYQLFFYARPKHDRNLFLTGLTLLDQALLRGILKKDEWEIILAGSIDVPPFFFTSGIKPTNRFLMSWNEYHQFLKKIDIGFCLMYSPHPSYPPLDVAASGGVALTNSYKNKQHFTESKNIISANLETETMMAAFKKAVSLAKNSEERRKHYLESRFPDSWENSFEPILNDIFAKETGT